MRPVYFSVFRAWLRNYFRLRFFELFRFLLGEPFFRDCFCVFFALLFLLDCFEFLAFGFAAQFCTPHFLAQPQRNFVHQIERNCEGYLGYRVRRRYYSREDQDYQENHSAVVLEPFYVEYADVNQYKLDERQLECDADSNSQEYDHAVVRLRVRKHFKLHSLGHPRHKRNPHRQHKEKRETHSYCEEYDCGNYSRQQDVKLLLF